MSEIKFKVSVWLDDIASIIHNKAVHEIHKTGKVVYTPFSRLMFKISRLLSRPFENLQDRYEQGGSKCW